MNSRERVIKAITFNKPDRIPVEAWILPSAWNKYGDRLKDELENADVDIVGLPFQDPTTDDRHYSVGSYTDAWGCTWHIKQEGMAGEVKKSPLEDLSALRTYKSPKDQILNMKYDKNCEDFCSNNKHKFIRGGWMYIFERMQFLRGVENLYMDIAEDSSELYTIRDIVLDYWVEYLKKLLQYDFDAITIGDDWGTQISLLVSPDTWRKVFKPAYKVLIDMAKEKGKYIFFHSDGNTLKLYDEFIDIGVNALNSQVWCIGPENLIPYAGKICFWGELSRQTTLPFGTPENIYSDAAYMKNNLTFNGGGLIGQSELDAVMPFENIEAFFRAWNK